MKPIDPPETPQQLPATPQNGPTISRSKINPVSICAGGMLICFFLPWINFFGIKPSGFDLQKTGGTTKLFWVIPILAAIALVGSLTGKSRNLASLVAGLAPFALLAFRLTKDGSDLFRVLSSGAWLSLALGLLLIIFSRR